MQTKLIMDFRDWKTVLNKLNYVPSYCDKPSNSTPKRELKSFLEVMDEVFHTVDKGKRENNARLTINSIAYPTEKKLIELNKQFPEIYPSRDEWNVDYHPKSNISVNYGNEACIVEWNGEEFPHHIGLEEITAGQEEIGKIKGKVSLNELPEIACWDIGPNPISLKFRGYSLVWNGSDLRIYSDKSFRTFNPYWVEILKRADLLKKEESKKLKRVFGLYGGIDHFVENHRFKGKFHPNLENPSVTVSVFSDSPRLRPSHSQQLGLSEFTESQYFKHENEINGLVDLLIANPKLMVRDYFDNRNHLSVRKNYLKIFDMLIPDKMKLALIYVDWATDWIGGGNDHNKNDLKYLLEDCSKKFGVDFSELSAKYGYCSRVRDKMKGSKNSN